MAAISPNATLAYCSPQLGTVAFGNAGALRSTPGAAGFIAPWAEVTIFAQDRSPVASERQGRLHLRRRGSSGDWIDARQLARRSKDNRLIIDGPAQL